MWSYEVAYIIEGQEIEWERREIRERIYRYFHHDEHWREM